MDSDARGQGADSLAAAALRRLALRLRGTLNLYDAGGNLLAALACDARQEDPVVGRTVWVVASGEPVRAGTVHRVELVSEDTSAGDGPTVWGDVSGVPGIARRIFPGTRPVSLELPIEFPG